MSAFQHLNSILTIADLQPESGGPSRTVPALAMALADIGVRVQLISLRRADALGAAMIPEHERIQVVSVPCKNKFAKLVGAGGEFKRAVLEACRTATNAVVHDNGLWLGTNHASAQAAQFTRTPFLISPRGMLTRWSLQHKGWKKRIAWQLYQRRDLQNARVLHATSVAEAQDFRALGLHQPIAVIPNGVEVPERTTEDRGQRTEDRTILFLSRIHPKKGLLNLVKAWASVQTAEGRGQRAEDGNPLSVIRRPSSVVHGQWSAVSGQSSVISGPSAWRIVIAGTDEGGHLGEVRAESEKWKVESARQSSLSPSPSLSNIEFVGAVEGEAKWDLYRSADLFVLPSHSENFGLVVAEALACGVPVITTRGTPWEELITHRCGWWVDVGVEPLANALREAMALSDGERSEMGARGRSLIERKYTWPSVAAQMKSVYEWMLGQGERPDCVV
jgi:glycosyltransferase involved in cell wall biosynthesis